MSQRTNSHASGSRSTANNIQGSKRWTHFYSALQLAIQRASHKWTYEDFAECFDLWCKETEGASGLCNTLSIHMENINVTKCDELLAQYNARENIDILHEVVTEARARRQAGEPPGPDTWRADLAPRAAVRARTIPILRQERDRLAAELAELEKENLELQGEIVDNVNATKASDDEYARLLAVLTEVEKKWTSLPLEDMQDWTLRAAESTGVTGP